MKIEGIKVLPRAPAASLMVTGSSDPVTSDSLRFLGRPFCTVPDEVIGLCSAAL